MIWSITMQLLLVMVPQQQQSLLVLQASLARSPYEWLDFLRWFVRPITTLLYLGLWPAMLKVKVETTQARSCQCQ